MTINWQVADKIASGIVLPASSTILFLIIMKRTLIFVYPSAQPAASLQSAFSSTHKHKENGGSRQEDSIVLMRIKCHA